MRKAICAVSQLSNVLIIAFDNQLSNVVNFINACQKRI